MAITVPLKYNPSTVILFLGLLVTPNVQLLFVLFLQATQTTLILKIFLTFILFMNNTHTNAQDIAQLLQKGAITTHEQVIYILLSNKSMLLIPEIK